MVLLGADLSGRWSGSVKMSIDGSEMDMPHEIVLKQQGESISGTAGPGADQQWPISKARMAGSELTFEVQAPESGPLFEYKLTVDGAQMTGDYKMTMEGQVSTAKIVIKKQ
jgi:hypothetical protein